MRYALTDFERASVGPFHSSKADQRQRCPRDGLSTCRPGERRDPSTPGVGDQRRISNGVTKA
jgi:hypothetical protein